jgi:hypothetical protein
MDIGDSSESIYPFPDGTVIQYRESAIKHSRHILDQGTIDRCLVIWVDVSVTKFPQVKRSNRLLTAAAAYVDLSSKNWREFVTFNTLQYGSPFAFEAEFITIQEAFRIACSATEDFDRLLIFSDCQPLLEGMRARSAFA